MKGRSAVSFLFQIRNKTPGSIYAVIYVEVVLPKMGWAVYYRRIKKQRPLLIVTSAST